MRKAKLPKLGSSSLQGQYSFPDFSITHVPDRKRPRLHDDEVGRKSLLDVTQMVARKRALETRRLQSGTGITS